MEEMIFKAFETYGLPGIILAAVLYLMNKMIENHRSERDEWRHDANEQHKELVNVTKDTHTILSKIETMLEK